VELSEAERGKNDLPDVLARWGERNGAERERSRTAQSFCVREEEIAKSGYDLSLIRYRHILHEQVIHETPADIIDQLETIEAQISDGLTNLREMIR
jgi:type I restriction enzyme M protein